MLLIPSTIDAWNNVMKTLRYLHALLRSTNATAMFVSSHGLVWVWALKQQHAHKKTKDNVLELFQMWSILVMCYFSNQYYKQTKKLKNLIIQYHRDKFVTLLFCGNTTEENLYLSSVFYHFKEFGQCVFVFSLFKSSNSKVKFSTQYLRSLPLRDSAAIMYVLA